MERQLNSGWTYREQLDQSAVGLTVLDYYSQRYRHSTQAEWQQRVEAGQILLDGRKTTTDTRLRLGQWLTYDRPPWQEPEVPLNVEVLHEDEDLMVVAKPAGLPVMPGVAFCNIPYSGSFSSAIPGNAHSRPPIRPGNVWIAVAGPITRSSRLFKPADARPPDSEDLSCAGSGCPVDDRSTITQPIGKIVDPVLGHLYAAHAEGLPACSEYWVLHRDQEKSLLEVNILTGRPHQIRIHLAAAGYPLVGDPLYAVGGVPIRCLPSHNGEMPVPGDCGYHLHAMRLSLIHPSGQPMSITCPPPPDLQV